MICAVVDQSGYVVHATLETYPNCSELALLSPAQAERLTYWADLAIALDPAEPDLYLFMAAVLGVFVTAWGVKQVVRLVLNR
jgi:hypothetical protein